MCVGVRGQQGGAGSLRPLHVPAGQTQPQLAVLRQQPLTQGQADAAGQSERRQTNIRVETNTPKDSHPTDFGSETSGKHRRLVITVVEEINIKGRYRNRLQILTNLN